MYFALRRQFYEDSKILNIKCGGIIGITKEIIFRWGGCAKEGFFSPLFNCEEYNG